MGRRSPDELDAIVRAGHAAMTERHQVLAELSDREVATVILGAATKAARGEIPISEIRSLIDTIAVERVPYVAVFLASYAGAAAHVFATMDERESADDARARLDRMIDAALEET